MKKIIACISLVFAMSAGVTALAEDGFVEGNKFSLESNDNDYTTVLIQKGTDTVYVNQDDSAFAAGTDFLLKGGTELQDGTYTVKMGGSKTGAAMSETEFVVSSEPEVEAKTTPMVMKNKVVSSDGNTYDAGFFAEDIATEDCKYIAITNTTTGDKNKGKTAYVDLATTLTGLSEVNVAIKVTNVPLVPVEKTFTLALTNTKPTN